MPSTRYNQLGEQEIHHRRRYNALSNILDPNAEAHFALRGGTRAAMHNPTYQTGGTPEEIYSRVVGLYQRGDPKAIAFVQDHRMEPYVGAMGTTREYAARPWPSRYGQPHYHPDNLAAAPHVRRNVNARYPRQF